MREIIGGAAGMGDHDAGSRISPQMCRLHIAAGGEDGEAAVAPSVPGRRHKHGAVLAPPAPLVARPAESVLAADFWCGARVLHRTFASVLRAVPPLSNVQPTITIDPSAMPAGTELSVGYFQLSSGEYSGQQQADVVLIDTSSYTCSSTPPDPNGLPAGYGPDDGIGLLYGGPGPAGS